MIINSDVIIFVSNDVEDGTFSGSVRMTEPELSSTGVFTDERSPFDDYIEISKQEIKLLGITPGSTKKFKLVPID